LVIQGIFPGFFYLFGKILINKKISKKQIILLLVILGVSFSLTSVISVVLNLLNGGFAQTNRLIPVFWTGAYVKATGLSGYLTYNMLILGIIISSQKIYNWLTKGILILIYIISLLCIFRLGSRTGIVLTSLTLVFAIVIVLLKQSTVKNLKFLFRLAVIGILIFNFVPLDLNADYLSTLGHRLQDPYASSSSSAGGRTKLWQNAIDNFIKYPLGWEARRYSHNVWLDVAKVGGIIPFILLIIFNFRNLYNLKTIFKFPKNNLEINVAFTLFTIGPLIYFFVEPALEGSFFVFTFFCLIQGILKGYILNHCKPRNKLENL
jgi:hypothetical protein